MTCNVNKKYLLRVISRLFGKSILAKKYYYAELFKPFADSIKLDAIYLLEARDQYCELGDYVFFYGLLNKVIKRKGAKAVMLGYTINPELLRNECGREYEQIYCRYCQREYFV